MFDHTFLDNEMPYYNNRYSTGSRTGKHEFLLSENSSIIGESPIVKLIDYNTDLKLLKEVKIENFVIKMQEFDLIKIPETRGIKFSFENDLISCASFNFEIVEKYETQMNIQMSCWGFLFLRTLIVAIVAGCVTFMLYITFSLILIKYKTVLLCSIKILVSI